MMLDRRFIRVRPATHADRDALLALTAAAQHAHSHLDWKPIDEWLGFQPFLLAEAEGQLAAALACPPDPADTAWIRFFMATNKVSVEQAWDQLWSQAHAELQALGVRGAAALSLEGWLDEHCLRARFERTHEVVVLRRMRGPLTVPTANSTRVRHARTADLAAITAVDTQAFETPWQMSPGLIQRAFSQADYLTVAEKGGQIIGYQLSTPGARGAHLARLAVLPGWQGQGIGAALVGDMVSHYNRTGTPELTVNTQDTNGASLTLYRRLGYELTGQRFPVYQLPLG